MTSPRILITRADGDAAGLRQALEALGAQVSEVAVIGIDPPPDVEPLERALAGNSRYDWIVFTSRNAVRAVAGRTIGGKVAAVGAGTAAELRSLGIEPALIGQGTSADLARDLTVHGIEGKRILIPQGNLARPDLAETLSAAGAVVETVLAYVTVRPVVDAASLAPLRSGEIDAVTLTSPSAYRNLRVALGDDSPLDRVALVCIGPTTAEAVRQSGRMPAATAEEPTVAALARAAVGAAK